MSLNKETEPNQIKLILGYEVVPTNSIKLLY